MDEAAKRKRISDPEGEPNAKRPAAQFQENNTFASKDPRAALAEVYAAYDALHRNRYTSEDEIKAGEAHFAVLLSAVQGDQAVQRLAIRLLPKFAPRFPSLISEAAMALQGLSSLNLNRNNATNGNNTVDDDVAGSNMIPIESLKGLKRMLLTINNNNNKSVAAAANGALHFALDQQLHPTTTEERRVILDDIAKAAFIACPRAVLSHIVEISNGNTEQDAHLHRAALEFLEKHLLRRVQDQEIDIKESLFSFENQEAMAEEKEEDVDVDTAHMVVLLAALRMRKHSGVDICDNNTDGFSTSWAVPLLQSVLQNVRSLDPGPSALLTDGLKAVLETLSPPGTTRGISSNKRARSGSPSPKPTTHTTNTRGTEKGSSYGVKKKKYTPPLPASGSSRPPRSSPVASAPTRRERGAKWSSRGPTPTLEEGELGELDEGELPPSQKQQQQQQLPRRSRSRDRGDRERGGERDRLERGRRRGSSSSPFPPSYSHRDKRDDRDRGDRERGGQGGDRGGGDRLHDNPKNPRLPPRDRDRDRDIRTLPPTSNQKVSGRGMPPLEYAGKALWVGQVPLGHSAERELVDAFSRYGQLTSHHIIARSSCAFINYVDVECAIEARERLDGARVAGSTLVVEFKGEKKYWESREGRERDRERERGDYRERERERDRGEYGRGDEYMRQSPYTSAGGGGGGVPPLPPQISQRGRGSRSRSRSPGGGGRRRNSIDAGGGGIGSGSGVGGGGGDGGWQSNQQPGRLYSMMSQEQLPSLPLSHASSQQLPFTGMNPAPVAGGGGGGAPGSIVWQGSLGKSRQPQAEVACLHSSHHTISSSSGWAAAEPAGWPAMLDVQNRISTAYVLNMLIPTLPPAERAVLQLIPTPGREATEAARLHAFSSYLQGKQRTGVVELGPGPQVGAPRQRALYLIPASDEACRAVGMGGLSGNGGEFMFAVVAAKSDEPGGMQ